LPDISVLIQFSAPANSLNPLPDECGNQTIKILSPEPGSHTEITDMPINKKLANWAAFSGVLLAAAFTSTAVFADTLPSITDDSYPQFQNSVTIKRGNGPNSDTWKISNKNGKNSTSQFFTSVSTSYTVSSVKYDGSVLWNPDGSFNTGTVSITGKVAGFGRQELMTATLDNFEWDSGAWLGFNTSNIQCSADLNSLIGGGGCTTNESLLIQLKNGWDGNPLTKGLNLSGIALTSVPLPAAAWLFVSGLGLIGVTARRNKKKTTV
jgi:hypothetical protein